MELDSAGWVKGNGQAQAASIRRIDGLAVTVGVHPWLASDGLVKDVVSNVQGEWKPTWIPRQRSL